MTLHLIGLGLFEALDVSVRGLQRIQAADKVYLERYTAFLAGTSIEQLEAAYGVKIGSLDRAGVETGAQAIVDEAKTNEVALLVVGDPMAATTHTDLLVRCRESGVPYDIIHGASIFSAAPGLVGLQHYKFGKTTTLVRPEENWMPTSPFDAIAENHAAGLHTLVLLDIKADENYCMSANDALQQILELAERTENSWLTPDSQAGVIARAGDPNGVVRTGRIADLIGQDFGPPLHCVIIPGAMQVVEEEAWATLRGD